MKKKKKESRKKYFWRDVYIGTVPSVAAELKKALAVAGGTNLQMLDQQTLSQETFVNALFIWAADLVERRGAKGLEDELTGAFARLSKLVEADMKAQGEAPPPGGKAGPEGFSRPGRPNRPGGSPGKKSQSRRRANGRDAE